METMGMTSGRGQDMLKAMPAFFLLAIVTLLVPGCAVDTGAKNGEPASIEVPISTEFGRMLGYVSYSFFEEHDIWFGNPGETKEMYGLEDPVSYGEIKEILKRIPEEQQQQFISDLSAALITLPTWNRPDAATLTGFDVMAANRLLCGGAVPPRGYFILEGTFDEELIDHKLTEQGYTKTDYGQHSYYRIRNDFEIDLMHPLSRIALASMNRVAVLDNTIITSPVAADITRIFDTIDGDTPSVIDNAICRSLADSLGDVLNATLTTPERIVYSDLYTHEEIPKFDFTLPIDWGILRGFRMAALGCHAEGDIRFFDIALFYDDEADAAADGQEIIKRMSGYTLNTWSQAPKKEPFIDWYQPGEPVVTRYVDGAVLTIACRILPREERYGISMVTGGVGMPFRDLLFLTTDPSRHIGKNESTVVIGQSSR
jgi:hypothetical protein